MLIVKAMTVSMPNSGENIKCACTKCTAWAAGAYRGSMVLPTSGNKGLLLMDAALDIGCFSSLMAGVG